MSVPYDIFISDFLDKITEFEFVKIQPDNREGILDGYMKRAFAAFRKNCKYDFFTTYNDDSREFDVDIPENDLSEISEIVSEGMIVQWLKPYLHSQELLQNMLNTRDFTTYAPQELLKQVGNAYAKAQKDFTQMIREYSYNHGDLTRLHL